MIYNLQERLNLSDQEVAQIKKEQSEVVFNNKILIAIAIVLVITFIAQGYFDWPIVIVGIFISIILLIKGIYDYNKEKNEFSEIVKDILVRGLFKEEFDKVVYQPDKGFDPKFLYATGLYPQGNRYSTDDLLAANYKGVGFMQADVLMQQVTQTGKTTTTTTLFHGRWFICDFIKDFDGNHQIRTNRIFKNSKPFWSSAEKTKKFEFESPKFNEQFTAYTNNPQEAFYLINPGYMNKLEEFVNYINEEVVFGFIDNKLHVAIFNNKDAFELKGNRIDQDWVDSIDDDINLIKFIIDDLDLELDIFK